MHVTHCLGKPSLSFCNSSNVLNRVDGHTPATSESTSIMSQNKLSLQNALLTLEQLQRTPSREDGITEEQEDNMRQLGCHLIQTTGILLKL
jgi:hypothetical protein